MSATEFTPERSTAIRQLLIDTVADEPRRRKRLQILLTSVLSGVAVVLAGGTAALALTGVIHLGGDTPPAPAPAPTQTVTPTPTPTPTPSSAPSTRPLVQSAPVMPHDVDSLRATTRWSLDLPGDPECTGMQGFTLSDARAVYVSGLRPKEYEGSDCVEQAGEDVGVTLVDTSDGTILWQREWKYTPKKLGFGATFRVLGTSGRGVFALEEAGAGPHDVLDLATGQTVATFQPAWDGFQPDRDMQPVPDSSGDIITIQHFRDAAGRPTADDVLSRSDPADLAHPKWSRSVPLNESAMSPTRVGFTAMRIEGYAKGSIYRQMAVDLETGASSPLAEHADLFVQMSQIQLEQVGSPSGASMELVAYGPDGRQLWSRTFPASSSVVEAETPGTVPGVPNGSLTVDTGEFFVRDPQNRTLSLIDQSTGEERWKIPVPACYSATELPTSAMLDVRRDAFLLTSSASSCAVSHESGAVVDAPSLLATSPFFQVFGLTHRYNFLGEAEPGTAHDLGTGELIWTRERQGYESWAFDGGYLLSHRRNHIESIG